MVSETPLPLAVKVDSYAGYRDEETPRRFWLAGVEIDIADVVDRWLAPDHRYFKVRDHQGNIYILRNDVAGERWELTFFRSAARDEGLRGRNAVCPDM